MTLSRREQATGLAGIARARLELARATVDDHTPDAVVDLALAPLEQRARELERQAAALPPDPLTLEQKLAHRWRRDLDGPPELDDDLEGP